MDPLPAKAPEQKASSPAGMNDPTPDSSQTDVATEIPASRIRS